MPATVLAERVGWTGSIRWFRENVKRLRPEHRPIDPADRLTWAPGDAAQCDLWFPPRKIPLEDGTAQAVAGAGDHRRALAVHDRADDPDPQDRGSVVGVVGADPAAGAGAAPVDLGQRARHRPRPAPRRGRGRVHGHAGDQAGAAAAAGPGVQGGRGAPQRLVRDLVHARPDVRLAGGLQRPVHRLAGRGRTRGWCARSRPHRSICSRPTGPRCCRCRRSRCIWAGATRSGSAATTTSAWTPTTTPSTRP